MIAGLLLLLVATPASAARCRGETHARGDGWRLVERHDRQWFVCGDRTRRVGRGRRIRVLSGGRDGALITARGIGSVDVALFTDRGRMLRRGAIHARVASRRRPRVVAARLDAGALVFGLDGAGRRGVYLATERIVRAVDLRRGVDPTSGRLAGGDVVWRREAVRHRQAVGMSWNELPEDCAVPPGGEDAVTGGGGATYHLRRYDTGAHAFIGCAPGHRPMRIAAGNGDVFEDFSPGFTTHLVQGELALVTRVQRGCFHGCSSGWVEVLRLTDAARPRGVGLAVDNTYNERVTEAVLHPSGAFAFVSVVTSFGDPPEWRVRASDRRGDAFLDLGPGLEHAGLSLQGTTLSWTNGGAHRSDQLQP